MQSVKRPRIFKPGMIVSERRACRVIAGDRTVIRYQSCRGDDEVLREKLGAGFSCGTSQLALEPRLRARRAGEWQPVPSAQPGR